MLLHHSVGDFATMQQAYAHITAASVLLDDPDEARNQVDLANRQWSREGFHLQHYYELLAHGQIDLYVGDGRAGLERTDQHWKALAGSMLLRVQNIRVEAHHLRARCALAEAKSAGNKGLLDVATGSQGPAATISQ